MRLRRSVFASPLTRAPVVLLLLLFTGSSDARADGTSAVWRLLAGPVNPQPMFGHAAVHDPLRRRMVFVDGSRPENLWCLSLPATGSPTWTRVPVAGTEYPSSRYEFTAVYDSAGDRAIVYGGYGVWHADEGRSDEYGDVWALSLGDSPRWTRIVPTNEGPHSRYSHAAVFDPIRRRMVIFGGNSYTAGQFADTWALDLAGPPTWTRLAANGRSPIHREGARAVYDPWNDRMVLFGGWVSGDYSAYPPPYYISDETWSLSLSNPASWDSLVFAVRPSARQTFVAVVDPIHRAMIVSGGEGWQNGHERDDTWALGLDGALEWTPLAVTGNGPGAVSWHAGDYSPERGSLIQYGGIWTAVQNECFELNLSTHVWSQELPPGPDPAPMAQGGAILVPDPRSDRPVLLGGVGRHDLWSFDERDTSWTRLATEGTTTGAQLAFDAKRRRMIAIGGSLYLNHGAALDDVWTLSLDEPRVWTPLAVQGPVPVGRFDFGLVYDPVRDRLILYGGHNWNNAATRMANDLGDVWEMSLAEPRWRQLQVAAAPGRRGASQLLYDAWRDRLLLIGGETSGYAIFFPLYDTWSASLGGDSLVWTPLGAPLPVQARVVLDPNRDRLVAWPGDARAFLLSLARPSGWSAASVSGFWPTDRFESALRYDDRYDRLLLYGGGVWGGFPSYSDAGDFYALDFSRRVSVDVRPGDPRDAVPRGERAPLEVAILASDAFSPESVLVGTVTLAGAPAFDRLHGQGHAEFRDVNRDGLDDLVLRFPAEALRLAPDDTVAVLLGETPNFFGRAHVRVIGRPGGRPGLEAGIASSPVRALSIRAQSPASAGLVIHYVLPASRPARLELFDVSGRRVLSRDVVAVEGEGSLSLETGALRPGVFQVRLVQDGRIVKGRVVVLR